MVCRRLQALSMPLVDVDITESGRLPRAYGSPRVLGSKGLCIEIVNYVLKTRHNANLRRRVKASREVLADSQWLLFNIFIIIIILVTMSERSGALVCSWQRSCTLIWCLRLSKVCLARTVCKGVTVRCLLGVGRCRRQRRAIIRHL